MRHRWQAGAAAGQPDALRARDGRVGWAVEFDGRRLLPRHWLGLRQGARLTAAPPLLTEAPAPRCLAFHMSQATLHPRASRDTRALASSN